MDGTKFPLLGLEGLAPAVIPIHRARGGTRTHTPPERPGGLSPLRLPIPPPGPASTVPRSTCPQSRTGYAAASSPESSTASHNAARARSALAPDRPFATTTPSIMSATTADHGRPRSATATVGTPPRRRSVRWTPSSPGGERNPGTTRERNLAACPRERAAAANRRLVASTDRHFAQGV